MINKELIEYIDKKLYEGIKKEDLINDLKKAGWTDYDINEAFKTHTLPASSVNKSKIFSDLLKGFFGILVYVFIVMFALFYLDDIRILDDDYMIFSIIVAIIPVLYIFLKLVKTDRRYISIGIILPIIGFLLFFGSCLLMFQSF